MYVFRLITACRYKSRVDIRNTLPLVFSPRCCQMHARKNKSLLKICPTDLKTNCLGLIFDSQ